MHGQDTTNEAVGARDQRPPSLGLGRIIIAMFWLLGAWILVMAIIDLFHAQGQPWGPRIVALLAGIDYLIAATALTHNGRRMRVVGWVTIALSIAIPVILWVASLGLDELNSARSAWTGLWYGLLLSAPRRVDDRLDLDVALEPAQDRFSR